MTTASFKSDNSSLTTLEGHIEHITYRNEKTNYTVARIRTPPSRSHITVVGYLAGISVGETLKLRGNWQTHSKYGQQFKAHSYDVVLPATIDGIRQYLQSGIVRGIGPSMASKLVHAFGTQAIEIIENNPERLQEVEGIGQAKAAMIHNSWKDHHTLRQVLKFLHEMGISAAYGAKIYQKYGTDAVAVLSAEPYQLADDFPGSGFLIADTIAQNLGLANEQPDRLRAGVIHMLLQSAEDGHTFAEEENLVARCENSLGVPSRAICNALDALEQAKRIVREALDQDTSTRAIYLKELHAAETGLANRLHALLSVPVAPVQIDPARIAAAIHEKLAIDLSAEQLQVLAKVFCHRVSIITGGPGTGKTTLLRSISALFEALGKKAQLAAPTGRAARRLADVTGRKTQTIHRMLGYNFSDGQFARNQDYPLDADAIIVDEASMVDTELMHHLLKAVRASATLVLVGDVFQLPSVGPGNVLSDMIKSGCIPVFYLNTIFRQEIESAIVVNAHRVRTGEFPEHAPVKTIDGRSDFYFLEVTDPQTVVATIVDLCRREIPRRFDFDPMSDIQVLAPMHKGLVGAIHLNQVLQEALNPNPVSIETIGGTFKCGDKVMHLKNNYQKDVYNGDIGTITEIDKKAGALTVEYYGHAVSYDLSETADVSIAYAISVHKSQGSEYPAVIVPLMTQHFALLQRNLLYTAMTRGKHLVILVGTCKALSIALRNDTPQKRLSRLAERLKVA